jgi:splicing factor 3B subunit 3
VRFRTCFLRILFLPLHVDYAIVGSDSGRIIILDYDPKTSSFVKLHQETFGKSGARRIVPGQYLATDPKGRAVMIAAVEKAKLVYILNRDAAANLTISSPLEAHKNSTIIHNIVGVDVGFENPTFAALEVDYTESDQDPTGEAFNKAEKVCMPTDCLGWSEFIISLLRR